MRLSLRCSCGATFTGTSDDTFARAELMNAAKSFMHEHTTHATPDDGSAAVARLAQHETTLLGLQGSFHP